MEGNPARERGWHWRSEKAADDSDSVDCGSLLGEKTESISPVAGGRPLPRLRSYLSHVEEAESRDERHDSPITGEEVLKQLLGGQRPGVDEVCKGPGCCGGPADMEANSLHVFCGEGVCLCLRPQCLRGC